MVITASAASRILNRTKIRHFQLQPQHRHHHNFHLRVGVVTSFPSYLQNVDFPARNITSILRTNTTHEDANMSHARISTPTEDAAHNYDFSIKNTLPHLHATCRNNSMQNLPFDHASNRSFSSKAYKEDSWEQPLDTSHNGDSKPSSRSLFKNIPIDQSILTHIRSIGVGMRPKKKRKRPNKKTSRRNGSGGIMNEADERDFFNAKVSSGNTRQRPKKVVDDDNEGGHIESVMLPPPFSRQTTINTEAAANDVTEAGQRIKRFPVKVLGSVGSVAEKMPRSSKGLPEVAIVGRSNVGKSTLLNALLYGNQFESNEIENKKYVRGKTPIGAMIGRGVKAQVSNKPGETKHITFYQLSSQILEPTSDSTGQNKKKISLVLADLPGFGFAYANEERARDWQELMKSYILHRGKSMKRVLFLIDARHGFKKTDFEFIDLLQDGLKSTNMRELPPIQIVLTKCDLVSQNDLARRAVQAKSQLSSVLRREPSALPIMIVSARAGVGFNNVRGNRARGGILELQRELAALVPHN